MESGKNLKVLEGEGKLLTNPTCGLRGSQACGEGDLYCILQQVTLL